MGPGGNDDYDPRLYIAHVRVHLKGANKSKDKPIRRRDRQKK